MTNRFYTHLTTIALVHALLIFGGVKFAQSQLSTSVKLPSSIMKVKVASQLLMSAPMMRTASPQKKVVAPSNKIPSPKVEARPETRPEVSTSSQGSLSNLAKADLKTIYYSELRAKIEENKSYPIMSKKLGQTGLVIVAFTLLEDGNIVNVRIDTPSRFERLNASALDAVKKVERFKPIPKEIGEAKMDIKVPVKFFTI